MTKRRMLVLGSLLGMVFFVSGSACALSLSNNIEQYNLPEKWSSHWQYAKKITIRETINPPRKLVPIDIQLLFPYEHITNPANEIRVITFNEQNEEWIEIPSQVYNISEYTQVRENISIATKSCRISFIARLQGKTTKEYFILYGNPKAVAPQYKTDLSLKKTKDEFSVDNLYMRCTFDLKSGQIFEIFVKMGVNETINHIFNGRQEVVHWNPDVKSPGRGWGSTRHWNPPPQLSIISGPVFVEISRSGAIPGYPEIVASVTYRIYSESPYIESMTTLEVIKDIPVTALRNDEMVFSPGLFTHVAWKKFNGNINEKLLCSKPIGPFGNIARLAQEQPWISFFNPHRRAAIGSIRLSYAVFLRGGGTPPISYSGTYIYSSPSYIYWVRGLVYPHAAGYTTAPIILPKGSIYHERNAYLIYLLSNESQHNRFCNIESYANELINPVFIEWDIKVQ